MIERENSLRIDSISLNSPRFFGQEGGEVQKTLISDEPFGICWEDYQRLSSIAAKVSKFIRLNSVDLDKSKEIGADPSYLKACLRIDSYGQSTIVYGGLDIYQDPNQGFRILEINLMVQAMNL